MCAHRVKRLSVCLFNLHNSSVALKIGQESGRMFLLHSGLSQIQDAADVAV